MATSEAIRVTLLPVHIVAGVLALAFGYVALYGAKGGTLHRRSGMLFVFAMVAMSFSGALIAFWHSSSISVVAGLLTFYFVTTALLLAAAGDQAPRRITAHLWHMCFAMWVAAASFFWGPLNRVPEMIRIPALLPIPVLTPIVVMLYWLWRIRVRRLSPGAAGVSARQTIAITAPDGASGTFR